MIEKILAVILVIIWIAIIGSATAILNPAYAERAKDGASPEGFRPLPPRENCEQLAQKAKNKLADSEKSVVTNHTYANLMANQSNAYSALYHICKVENNPPMRSNR